MRISLLGSLRLRDLRDRQGAPDRGGRDIFSGAGNVAILARANLILSFFSCLLLTCMGSVYLYRNAQTGVFVTLKFLT